MQPSRSPRTRQELVDLLTADAQVEYLFFWGHRPRPDGSIGPGCLSQWWPAPFTVQGLRYVTAEHFMMAAKARLFGDASTAEQILTTPDPAAAKALGRQIRGFDEPLWQEHRWDIVVTANTAKFGQNPQLRTYLTSTGERILVEASPTDQVWASGCPPTIPGPPNHPAGPA